MRVLFVHQNFPGQFKLLASSLATRPGFEVLGLGDAQNIKAQGRTFQYKVLGYVARPRKASNAHHYLGSFEAAIRRGQDIVRAFQQLRSKGFVPDLVVGHPAWGELLFVKDVFPDCRVIAYFEFLYRATGLDVAFDPEFPPKPDDLYKLRIRNSTQLQALASCDAGISPTQWQRSTYPAREQARIRVIHEGIDVDAVCPDPAAVFHLADGRTLTARDKVVTYVSRQLEPYRGFHAFMRALPELQKRLPDAQFVIVGGDGVSYGTQPPAPHATYREMLMTEVGSRIDPARTHFTGRLPYIDYLRLLQISRLHVYLTYPFVLSWSMLEAMACETPLLASATPPVEEMICDGVNGYLFDFFNREQLVERAVEIAGMSPEETAPVRQSARHEITSRFSFQQNSLPAYLKLIEEVAG